MEYDEHRGVYVLSTGTIIDGARELIVTRDGDLIDDDGFQLTTKFTAAEKDEIYAHITERWTRWLLKP